MVYTTHTENENTKASPLGARGVNFYAYGGPAAPETFAARSDPKARIDNVLSNDLSCAATETGDER